MEEYRRIVPLYSVRGFSLFELLVVLVIIGLMSAFAVPQMAGSLMKMNALTAAKKLGSVLRYARSRAVAEKIPYIAVISWEDQQIAVQDYRSLAADLQQKYEGADADEGRAKIYAPPDGIRMLKGEGLADGPASYSYIAFYTGGGSSGGNIIIADEKERSYLLHVDFITGSVECRE
ncbi:MAG: prepilin-type N-terminal cleavage/methylation domain-containing protein [Desulfococcaceae bacterium]|nr:prepilin-type N-terminal cleavage/methylation domain-containing protein [Desulfococcaceae bacterium]